MAKVTLSTFASIGNETSFISTLNTNFTNIQNAMDITVSRDGTSVNTLSADLDFNSQQTLNLAVASASGHAVRFQEFDALDTQVQGLVALTTGIAAAASASASAAATSETNAAASAAAAAASAAAALVSETNAGNSETAADASATSASSDAGAAESHKIAAALSETNAATSETNAATSETNASTSASNASTSETNAATSETNAAASEVAAAASADAVDDLYLGSKASAPTLDNDSDPLADGALYFNTTDNTMYVYDLGNTTWVGIDGTLGGSMGATDNVVPRTDGTGGSTLQSSGVTITDGDDLVVPSGSDITQGPITGFENSGIWASGLSVGVRSGGATYAGGQINLWAASNNTASINSTGLQLASGYQLQFSSSATASNLADTWIHRLGAGSIGIGATTAGTDGTLSLGDTLDLYGQPSIITGDKGNSGFSRVELSDNIGAVLVYNNIDFINAGSQLAWGSGGTANIIEIGNDSFYRTRSDGAFAWSDSASDSGNGDDLVLSRNAAGVLQIGTTAANASGSIMAVDATLSNDLLLGSGSIINWNAGDVTLTHSSNVLTMAGATYLDLGSGYYRSTGGYGRSGTPASQGMQFSGGDTRILAGSGFDINFGDAADATKFIHFDNSETQVKFKSAPVPNTNDGAALGSASLGFSDLFLADGGKVYYDSTSNNYITADGSDYLDFYAGGSLSFRIDDDHILSLEPIKIAETAAAVVDSAGYGQLWVKDNTPNDLYFTDDSGQDVQLSDNGALAYTVTEADVTAHEGAIDHDALTNFVADEHIDWTPGASAAFGTTGGVTLGTVGIDFGSQIAATDTSLAKHIDLYGGAYGFNIVSGEMQAIHNSAVRVNFTSSGINVIGGVFDDGVAVPTISSSSTLTNKTIDLDSNTVTGTIAEFNTACQDAAFATSGGAFHDGFSDFVANEHIDWTSTSSNFSTSGTVATGRQTVTGGSTYGSTAAAGANVLTDHISLWGTSYGLSITGNTINVVTGGTHIALCHGATDTINVLTGSMSAGDDDTVSLGLSGLGYSDLFLSSGSVINFNAGDVALTHSSNLLTISGGGLTVSGGNLTLGGNDIINGGVITIAEQAASLGDVAGRGQLWAHSSRDAGLHYTDDTGADYNISSPDTYVIIQVIDDANNVAVKDASGDIWYRVPAALNGWNLTSVAASVSTAGTTGTCDIQVRNKTQAADMLSTKITIDTTETDSSTAATPAVIDTANDDVATGDQIVIDVDAIHTTPAVGLQVELGFSQP